MSKRREAYTEHHILHYERYWTANCDNMRIRRAIGMVALMDPDAHRELHARCPGVPPLDIFTAQRARMLYTPDHNPLRAIDNLCYAIDGAAQHPKTHSIERKAARLTIDSIRLQIPYIRTGLVTTNV